MWRAALAWLQGTDKLGRECECVLTPSACFAHGYRPIPAAGHAPVSPCLMNALPAMPLALQPLGRTLLPTLSTSPLLLALFSLLRSGDHVVCNAAHRDPVLDVHDG